MLVNVEKVFKRENSFELEGVLPWSTLLLSCGIDAAVTKDASFASKKINTVRNVLFLFVYRRKRRVYSH